MSEEKPKTPPWFAQNDGPTSGDPALDRQMDELRKKMPQLLRDRAERRGRGRADQFYPYLLVRSLLGDRGDRPFNLPFWESPDIWTAAGHPNVTPAVPGVQGGIVTAGEEHTVYAHVWNLGLAPIAGITVEFYWFNPSLAIDGADAHLIGHQRVDLGGRTTNDNHRLVKCPKAWVPENVNHGHECLVVRVSSIGDAIGNNEWEPQLNRHVAQRNISVVPAGGSANNLLHSLNLHRLPKARVQLLQLGALHASAALGLVASHLRVPAETQTLILAEYHSDGKLRYPDTAAHAPAAQAPIHPLAAGLTPPFVEAREAFSVPRIRREAVFAPISVFGSAPRGGHLADLLRKRRESPVATLHLDEPLPNQAQVLRFAALAEERLVGGYTVIVSAQPPPGQRVRPQHV